jgi:hypothetical protein
MSRRYANSAWVPAFAGTTVLALQLTDGLVAIAAQPSKFFQPLPKAARISFFPKSNGLIFT